MSTASGSMPAASTATDRQLFEAIRWGNHSLVVALLKQGASPNAVVGPDQASALHVAAMMWSLAIVQELLLWGADPDARTVGGATPLHIAAVNGHMDVAAALIEGKASVDAPDEEGFTPFHIAASQGHLSTMEVLLDAGCNINAGSADGATPLIVASREGKHQAASLLLASGAAVEAACEAGYTALHSACEEGNLEAVTVLLRGKASLTAVTMSDATPLFLASSNGHEQVVRLLLSKGADPYTPNSFGNLPLHVACGGNHMGVVTRLLRGRRTPAHVNALGHNNFTPLHVASKLGYSKLVPVLIKAGADVDARTSTHHTPLHLAVIHDHGLVLGQLLAAGADPAALLQDGANALHEAVMCGHASILQVLLPAITAVAGQGVVDDEYQGMTPLHWAVEKGHASCVEMLLAAGANPDKLYGAEATDGDGVSLAGISPLFQAVQLQHTAIVPLLATPANMSSCWEGQTPLHCALRLGVAGTGMAQALVAAGAPAGVVATDGTTALSLAGSSSEAAIRGLLPGMVRGECARYKQLQQKEDSQQQQQYESQQAPAAVLAAVVKGLSVFVQGAAAAGLEWMPTPLVESLPAVMEVLGAAVGGDLLQQVLSRVWASSLTPAARRCMHRLLCTVLHDAWLADLQPLLQQRGQVTNRFQMLVTQPLQPQPARKRQQKKKPQHQVSPMEAWTSTQSAGLAVRLAAAAAAGQWQLWVHLLEQLAGLHEVQEQCAFQQLLTRQAISGTAGLLGLCEALLRAWVAARQNVAHMMQRELAGAVLAAVWVWQQQQ